MCIMVLLPTMKLDIHEIDSQHEKLLQLLAQAVSIVELNQNPHNTLTLLMAEFEKHFSDEIEYMTSLGFPFIGTHLVEHTLLVARLNNNIAQATRSELTHANMSQLLQDAIDHIEQYDVLYAEYAKVVKQKGEAK